MRVFVALQRLLELEISVLDIVKTRVEKKKIL